MRIKRGPATYKSEDMRAALQKLLSESAVIDVHMLIRAYKDYMKEKTGVEPNIEVKNASLFLRHETLRRNGLVKRVDHGRYVVRTDPADRGLFYTRERNEPEFTTCADNDSNQELPMKSELGLDRILDDAIILSAKIDAAIRSCRQIGELKPELNSELKALCEPILRDCDAFITDMSAVIAWYDDYVSEQSLTGSVLENSMQQPSETSSTAEAMHRLHGSKVIPSEATHPELDNQKGPEYYSHNDEMVLSL